MLKELGFVKDNSKYYISNIDEKLSEKEMTVKELSKINIEMQELLRNKELLMKNKKIIEETQKLYQRLKNFSFKEHILLKKEEFENFDNYLYQVEKISESLKEYYENGEIFDFEDRKSRFDTEYKKWTGEDFVSVEDMIKNSDEILEKINFRNRTQLCKFWQNEVPSETEGKNREKILKFKERKFIYTPIVETSTLTNDELKNFLCKN